MARPVDDIERDDSLEPIDVGVCGDAHPDASQVPDPALPPGLRRRVRGFRPVRVAPRQRRHRLGRRPVIALIVAAAAGVVMLGGFLGWRLWQQRLWEQRRGTGVPLELVVPGYGEGSSPVPLRVSGTTDEGSTVAGVRIVTKLDGWLSLLPGSYTVTAVGSPVTAAGGMFSVPKGSWRVEVTSDGGSVTAPDGTVSDEVAISYTPLSPADITDDQVGAIRAWMLDVGVQGVDRYVESVEATR